MAINWSNLRSLNGSQRKAFEELCCQLAAHENIVDGASFTRKGDPDAGVECFWALPDGNEIGWQAKFFLTSPNATQWGEIDSSIKTALEKHPQLSQIVICLPIDRSDARLEGQKSFLDKWNEYVVKWKGYVAKERSVDFQYWGEHEIFQRLHLEEHAGRFFFWFNEPLFSQRWFEERLASEIEDAGKRYTPELNVTLPISRIFDGLGRTEEYAERIAKIIRKIKYEYDYSTTTKSEEALPGQYSALKEAMNKLLSEVDAIDTSNMLPIKIGEICNSCDGASENIWSMIDELKKVGEENEKNFVPPKEKDRKGHPSEYPHKFDSERHHLHNLYDELYRLKSFLRSKESQLTNTPFLVMFGDAGTGKTHLLCDVAKNRIDKQLPTVILLGQKFNTEEPWTQIIKLLHLSCTPDQFLGALQARAEISSSRALIFIDALNEGDGKRLWSNYLRGMLRDLSKYPRLGLAVSIRSSYSGVVLPDGILGEKKMVYDVHQGFSEKEYEATARFFDNYGIERPSIPLLLPEFRNPLFLKLFCEALSKKGVSRIPKGLHGFQSILSFYVNAVNQKISGTLDLDVRENKLQKSIDCIAEEMANRGTRWLPRDDAKVIVNALHTSNQHSQSLFYHLISEGILMEDRFQDVDGIHFSYERLADYQIAHYLIAANVNSGSLKNAFRKDRPIGQLFADERCRRENQGLLDAFAVLMPEKYGVELPNLHSDFLSSTAVKNAFLESLIWRDYSAFSDATLSYINDEIICYQELDTRFLNTLLNVACIPDHPYNAAFLDENLRNRKMADRDAWWSIYLFENYGYEGSIDRVVDWAWSEYDKSIIDEEAILLCGKTLTWFLTTSHRYLRDRSTKALVNLFTKRLKQLFELIKHFINVNDPYVLERLLAVAYGCAMREPKEAELQTFAQQIYDLFFKDGNPPVHSLTRDYARNVVELAQRKRLNVQVQSNNHRPIYMSKWPTSLMSKEELKQAYYIEGEERDDADWGQNRIYSSIFADDFAWYVIGTNSGNFEWTSIQLGEDDPPCRKELYEKFIQSLTKKQKALWDEYHELGGFFAPVQTVSTLELQAAISRQERNPQVDALEKKREEFVNSLDKRRIEAFENDILPYITSPHLDEQKRSFDLSIAQRFIMQRVFELGWTRDLFGKFDGELTRRRGFGREGKKVERIGKKYQWIAYYEFLARVADNFKYNKQWEHEADHYEGPWQNGYTRNIDPSSILHRARKQDGESSGANINWWFPTYDKWLQIESDEAWAKSIGDIHSADQIVELSHPEDGSSWLLLWGQDYWEFPKRHEEERYSISRRHITYNLRSCFVLKEDLAKMHKFSLENDVSRMDILGSSQTYDGFLGECYWAPYFTDMHAEEIYDGLEKIEKAKVDIVIPAHDHSFESEYDCSTDGSISMYIPSKWLTDRMELRWNGVEGQYANTSNEVVAFDPSIRSTEPRSLVVRKDDLLQCLNDNGYEIIWIFSAQKMGLNKSIGHIFYRSICTYDQGKLNEESRHVFEPPRNQE